MKSLRKRIRACLNALRGEARISGIRLPIDQRVMSPRIQRVLGKTTYESSEAELTARVVIPGDTVLELGAGLGFVSAYLRKNTAAGNIICVEANPDLIPYISKVHALNDINGINVLNGIVVTSNAGRKIPFYCRQDFWMSSMEASDAPFDRVVETLALDLSEMLDTYKPAILTLDIEGGELDLLSTAENLAPVRAVIVEVHPKVYGSRGVAQLTESLRRLGLTEDPRAAMGAVRSFFR